jgi:hypothetical protein
MGTISHNAIVVTSGDEVWMQDAAVHARSLGCSVLGPSEPVTNGYCTLVVCPDGSKEGWGTSANGDSARDEFIDWLLEERKQNNFADWVEIRYGELGYAVVRSDEDPSPGLYDDRDE